MARPGEYMNIDTTRPVKVYRNLKHGKNAKPLYSIMQDGRVVERRHSVILFYVKFKVSEAGRQRVIKQGRKNVHAFAIGYLRNESWFDGLDARVHVSYNPYKYGHFYSTSAWGNDLKLHGANAVLFDKNGMTAAYVY